MGGEHVPMLPSPPAFHRAARPHPAGHGRVQGCIRPFSAVRKENQGWASGLPSVRKEATLRWSGWIRYLPCARWCAIVWLGGGDKGRPGWGTLRDQGRSWPHRPGPQAALCCWDALRPAGRWPKASLSLRACCVFSSSKWVSHTWGFQGMQF